MLLCANLNPQKVMLQHGRHTARVSMPTAAATRGLPLCRGLCASCTSSPCARAKTEHTRHAFNTQLTRLVSAMCSGWDSVLALLLVLSALVRLQQQAGQHFSSFQHNSALLLFNPPGQQWLRTGCSTPKHTMHTAVIHRHIHAGMHWQHVLYSCTHPFDSHSVQ